ncbi:uncharacterized protein LOC123551881 isoform X1 [Mercenaria mercenaria]|uniref:uncharacterized protein LOC123551881 isoform X1 n=1 Tax=Mercenaria mercenaria TaxID=6596 RepID=UPI00234F2E02|nr:uncharacterized protein LOC123551881 isoform X1 [Mercenaria mercenaria]
MSDYYNRLVIFVIDICPRPQRQLLLTLAEQAFPANSQTFKIGSFLQSKKSYIDQLLRWKKIREDQHNSICKTFDKSDLNDWDISLLSVILKEMFRVELKQEEHDALAEIRMVRNELQHKSSTTEISEHEFRDAWLSLENATLLIARNAYRDTSSGQRFQNLIQIEINTVKSNAMPNITGCLATWNTEIKKEMKELRQQIDIVGVDSRFSRDALTSLTVKQTARSGIPMKRMRTLDPRLEKLKDNFAASFERFSNQTIPICEDADKITRHLKANHWVLVSSYDSMKAYIYALRAIKDMSYSMEYSLEVTDPSDWSHIGFEDAELVVFKYPFGKDAYDESKATAMVIVLDNIMQTTGKGQKHGLIDVVIVSSSKLLEECRRNHEHDMLDHAVTVCPGTTEKEPIDLTNEQTRRLCTEPCDSVYKNMLDMSQCYLRQHKLEYKNVQLMQKAKMKFNDNKVLVICGPKGSGKTTLAISLLKAYQDENFLLLTEPEELKYVRQTDTLAILIENLAGYMKFDETEANKWFRKFDLLNAAVMDGCWRIVITMQQGIFGEWSKLLPKHPLLDSAVQLSRTRSVEPKVKQEQMDVNDIQDTQMPYKSESTTRSTRKPTSATRNTSTDRHVWSVQSENTYPVQQLSDRFQCIISGICILPSGELLVIDELNVNIKKLDQRYSVVHVRDLPTMPLGLCYLGENVAVVSMITTLQFINVSGNINLTMTVDTDHSCFSIAGHEEKLYVAALGNVQVYDRNGQHERSIDIGPPNPISGMAVSRDGEMLYVTKRMAITKYEWSGLITTDTRGTMVSELQLNSCDGVCIDRNGNVLVLCANGVVQVSADGKCILDLLTDDDTLGESICFDEERSSLIASHSVGNTITVFELA